MRTRTKAGRAGVAVLEGALARIQSSGIAALVVSSILLYAPRAAIACSVCTAGRDEENQTAFLISTIFLSVVPLASLGTLVFILWRRIQKLEASDLEQPLPQDR